MRTNEQTRSRQGRGTRGDGRTPSALRAARGEGPGPGGRGAPQLPGRATAAAAARPSTGLHHCSPCTHTHTLTHSHGRPDPDSGGKTGSPAPDGQAGPSQGRTGAPTSQAPGPVPAEGAGRAGGWGGAGLQGAGRPLAPSPRAGRRSHDLETDLELSRRTLGPFSQPGLQWPSCLQCHECIVSFINFKYKQNKNHIFLRQQQFSR